MPDPVFQSTALLSPGNQIYLERKRIDCLLEKAIQNLLVVVVAGAGYGKTHAVYSFVRKYHARTSWMQLSERDNVADRFWENFIAGVALSNPKAASRLEKIDFPETERQLERYMAVPLEEIDPAARVILVYDDFHFIQNPAVLRFLEKSFSGPFPNITSVIISRNEPPINTIRFLSKGLLGRITEEDLRFSREELTEYFSIQNIRPLPQVLSSIYHDTEGWAFAIHLAGLSLKSASPGTPYIPQAMRKNIFILIKSEVMEAVSEGLQRFLIKLSLIEHLVPELLEDLAGDHRLIQEMNGIDSFVRFETYHNEYHIHHLFLDYLKTRQDEIPEEEKKETWNKTAMWCEANNQKTDAINYYKKAENYERLILVMFMLPFAMANRTARMLLEILRPEICTIVPSAYIIRAKLYIILGMPEQADKELVTTIEALKAQPPSPEINRVLSGCYNFRGFAGIQTSTYTRDYNYLHYFKNARQYYDKSPFETKPPMSVGFLSTYVCRVNSEEKGEMERYIDAITAMVPHTSYTLGGFGSGMENLTRAELAFFKGDLSVAEQAAYTALNKARQADQYEIENRALFYLLRINLARGNWEAVQGVFKQMEAQLDQPYYLNRFIFHDIVAGWYYAHIGQTEKPVLWLKNDFEESDFGSTTFDLEILVKAKYHFSEKRYPAALAVLKSRELKDGHRDYVLGKIEKKALEAVCRHRSRDRSGAFASLETAYRLAAPNGLDMPFIELGKDMRSLANAALKDGSNIPCEWLEKIRLGASAYAKNLFTVISRLFDLSTRPDSRDKFSRRNAVRIAAKMNLG